MCLFGDICKELESVCDDVDEVVNHEPIKYIERKVQNVGENVMKFYATIAQVIVTPIMIDLDQFNGDEEINQQEQHDSEIISYYTIDTQSTVDDEICFHELNDDKKAVEHYEESDFGTDESSSSASSNLSSTIMPIASDVASSTIRSSGTMEEMLRNMWLPNEDFHMNFNEISSSSSAIAFQNNANKWHDDYLNFHIGSSMESSFASSMESPGSSSGYQNMMSSEITDLDKEAKKLSHDHQVKQLEESCVIVDYSTPHDDVSCEAQKHPSFKEKILTALSSKKRLEGEYKELAIWHRENKTKCFQGTSLCDPTTMLLRDSQTIHSNGSEWELI